jgi:hypothetical protein
MKLTLLLLSAALANAAVETPVDLGTASNYAILAKSGISTVPTSAITGDIGVSPIAATAITGFGLALDSSTRQFSTASQIRGQAHAADYGGNVAAELTVAVLDMQAAYTDAASRTTTDSSRINLLDGSIGGQTLTPGVYTFTKNINVDSNLTFEGGADDVFIIQTTGILTVAANAKLLFLGGVQAKNIFWQVAGNAAIGAGAEMQGVLLVFTDVLFSTGSSLYGSILAQTAVNLQMATITQARTTAQTGVERPDIPCSMGQPGVGCCDASDCGDTTFFTCEAEQCVPLSCSTKQTGVECCEDAECGDTDSFRCEANSCVLRDCDTSLQDVECCDDDDCSSRGSGSISCVSNVCINQGDPRFTLTWFGDGKFFFCVPHLDHQTCVSHTCLYIFETDDLDLHVLTPGGNHIYYEKTFDPVSKGRLDHDDIPQVAGLYVESVYFPLDRTAPLGNYTYYVRNWEQRGVAPDAWKLEVYMGDNLVAQHFDTTASRTNSDQYTFVYDGSQ